MSNYEIGVYFMTMGIILLFPVFVKFNPIRVYAERKTRKRRRPLYMD